MFLGNAGTAFRPLTAALALNGGHYRLSGVPRMHERPIGDLVDALRALGADIRYLGKEGFPPLEIFPAPRPRRRPGRRARRGVEPVPDRPADGAADDRARVMIVEVEGDLISKPYVEITLRLMALFGVKVARDGWAVVQYPGRRSATAARVWCTSKAMRPVPPISWPRVRSAGDRCGSKA